MKRLNRWSHALPLSLINPVADLFKSRKKARRRHLRTTLEQLESRTMLSIDFSNAPAWVSQGPGPIEDNRYLIPVTPVKIPLQNNPSAGAVEAIAIDPNNAKTIYAGTVNGGIWKTGDGDTVMPSWTPETDQAPSLSTRALVFGAPTVTPTGKLYQTLFAATGSVSSSRLLGVGVGILKSTDAGATW